MLSQLAVVTGLTIVAGAAYQLLLSCSFLQLLKRQKKFVLPFEHQHSTAVLICVRGCDPTLERSIVGVLNQQFDQYQVHVIVDHRTDEAWDVLHQLKADHDVQDRMRIHEMPAARKDCGLKCLSLVKGIESLDIGTHYIALLDADVCPHPTWLAEITGPLQDPSIGVSTGNQWFECDNGFSPGSMTRSLWNAGALVPTAFFQNPWAGSLAMRMRDVRDSGLFDTWKHCLVDDGPVRDAFRSLGLKIHFAPSIVMVNRERSRLPFVQGWITRMLTWSRLYERTFGLTVFHSTISTLVMTAAILTFLASVVALDGPAMAVSGLALLTSGVLSLLAWLSIRSGVAYSCGLRGEKLPRLTFGQLGGLYLMIVVAQYFYAAGCARALFANTIQWREITYGIENRSTFEMISYQPISTPARELPSRVSI